MNTDRVYYSRDAEINALRERAMLTLVFLALGLGIGAALALLFAPASGKVIRHDLARNLEEGVQTGRETLEPLVKRLEEKLVDLHK